MTPASQVATMVDVAFPLRGGALPQEHRRVLADALLAALPWLADSPGAGVHRIKVAAGSDRQTLLSGRSRLTLRLPREQVSEVSVLVGTRLALGGQAVELTEPPAVRELLPHRTLYAHAVQAAGRDELAFLAAIEAELAALGVACRCICGRAQRLVEDDARSCSYSLMLDGLGPDDALRVLETGLGAHRLWGCGLFVPHRSAAAVGA